MKTELQHCIRLFELGELFVMATVLSHRGSVPRRAGARMIIQKSGKTFGTVGGGSLEAEVVQYAETAFASKNSGVKQFDLSGNMGEGTMLCGGQIEVLIDYMNPSNHELIRAWHTALQVIQKKEKGWLITSVPDDANKRPGEICCITVSGDAVGTFVPSRDFLETLYEKSFICRPGIGHENKKRFFIEPLTGLSGVFIFGSGHVAQQLAMLTVVSGFKTTIIDDRRDYLVRRYFPIAEELVLLKSYDDPFTEVRIDRDSYVIILTRDPALDRNVLNASLATDAAYIGMIGSGQKCRTIKAALELEGADPEAFSRLHAPIGISIGAETPEEVAISIVAELIQKRAGVREISSGGPEYKKEN